MPKIQVCELAGFSTNIALKNIEKQYKNYCTIRRDLRAVDSICTYVMAFHKSIKNDKTELSEVAETAFLIRGAAMHSIILYSRWFKATSGKTRLLPTDFFVANSKDIFVHEKVVKLRDSYIAHNELELLGSDKVWVNTDGSGKFVSSESDWIEQMWIQDKDLNMATFQKCVHIVHNKLDAEVIPKWQRNLDRELKELLGTQA